MQEKKFLTRGKVLLAVFIVIIILIIYFSFKIIHNSSIKKYNLFEDELRVAAENYYIIKDISIDYGEEKNVTIDQLSSMKLIYNELKDKCSGYVIISNEKDIATDKYKITYRPYIKCGKKYMTANYSEY